ncbi:MAG: hypothetical protein QF926_13640 [Alphaproteobacteria bacterium]|jgi:hypothetical protein|nr:hypothetical protein [Alphaproteobacteria bacterium]MDP6517642.1 hypothetical protein [Alphaproteobacteria bacterium]|tara:strand:+ start:66 stop:254 length:189 start_codon:yes stop_codon:yes gene_type:complete
MADRVGSLTRSQPVTGEADRDARRQQLAERLRENLKKRKEQRRQRDERAKRALHKGLADFEV